MFKTISKIFILISVLLVFLFAGRAAKLLFEIQKTSPGYMQRKTPDDLSGLREFYLGKVISDYHSSNYELIQKKQDSELFIIEYSVNKPTFLNTYINSVYLTQYHEKICEITLMLNSSVYDIIENMFRHEEKTVYNDFQYANMFSTYTPNFVELRDNEMDQYNLIRSLRFLGVEKILQYNEYNYLPFTLLEGDPRIGPRYCLTLRIYNYKEKFKKKYLKEHYDAFLSDFETEYYPYKDDIKKTYNIPLFEFNNTYYIRALFGDVVDNIIFDTGADQLIISKTLYDKLKENDLVADDEYSMKMLVASRDTITLQRTILKSIQLNDLNVRNVEAYINTSDDISLLGQSFLKRFGKITVDHELNLLTIEK